MKLAGIMGVLIFVAWALASCGRPAPERYVIVGPIIHPKMEPTRQEVDLINPPASAIAPRWKPGDPTIEPGDFSQTMMETMASESWFSRLLRRICCAIFSCQPKPPDSPEIPAEPTKVTKGADFNGIPGTQYVVPDPVGDIGPDHYVQAVNSAFRVFDTTGTPLTAALFINHLWENKPGPCKENNPRDPIVRYDKQADRWLISGFVTPSAKYMCIAVSQTPDPANGQWFLYTFKAEDPVSHKPFSIDFPKLSVWPDAYYLGTVESYTLGLDVMALERSKMLAGQAAGVVRFYLPAPGIVLLPGDPDGPPPPAGSPAWFARQIDGERVAIGADRIELYSFSVDWGSPGDSSFVALNSLPVDPFDSVICTNDDLDVCVPQPDPNQKLETLSIMPQWRLQYRNMGAYESLLFNHTIDINSEGHAGIRWYELRRPTNGAWAVTQQGNHYDPDLDYFMGSISMDRMGNIALGYTASSSTVFPGIRIAHRMAGNAPGSMPGTEYIAVTGSGSQINGNPRWGDYSTMDVDPVDDCTFWYTHEYYEVSSKAGWLTRIISFKLPGCE